VRTVLYSSTYWDISYMNKHITQDAIDSLAHLIYNGGRPMAIAIGTLIIAVVILVRLMRFIFRIPIIAWVIGYIIYKKR
jgi:hypothetical protein